jgi:predicted dehydrogenase
MMQVLVIGYGSIGMRHAEVLESLGCEVSILSGRQINVQRFFSDIAEAINIQNPKYIVVANKTSEHIPTLIKLKKIGFKGDILIEKPLSNNLMDIPSKDFSNVFVAYNMRFNPLIQRLSNELINETIISSQAYVGQYLPNWRLNRDYRKSYSAKKDEGGGVLRDLSHELDFMNWIFGGWKRVAAIGGKYSELEIDSDDVFGLMFETKNCPLCLLQLNYLDRSSRRDIVVNTNQHVFRIDFINKTFEKDGVIIASDFDSNYSYSMQHKAIIEKEYDQLCSFNNGKDIMRLIIAAENSAYKENNNWIKNEKNL